MLARVGAGLEINKGGRGQTDMPGMRRVRSERRGPDIQRPLDVRDPVCQSAGSGEMRRHRSIMIIRERDI